MPVISLPAGKASEKGFSVSEDPGTVGSARQEGACSLSLLQPPVPQHLRLSILLGSTGAGKDEMKVLDEEITK